jgi:hypothetical protein
MFLNAFRMRLALLGAGVLVMLLWLALGGSFSGPGPIIFIEFGGYPDDFLGCEVMIDDQPAGRLTKMGSAFRTGFAVDEGAHEVWIHHPEIPCKPITVHLERGAHPNIQLFPDFTTMQLDGGQSETVITFLR